MRGQSEAMNSPSLRDQLRSEIDALPDALAEEVIDFIIFVKDRHAEDAYLWQQVEAAQAHRDRHPEDVRTVTVDELEALTGPEQPTS